MPIRWIQPRRRRFVVSGIIRISSKISAAGVVGVCSRQATEASASTARAYAADQEGCESCRPAGRGLPFRQHGSPPRRSKPMSVRQAFAAARQRERAAGPRLRGQPPRYADEAAGEPGNSETGLREDRPAPGLLFRQYHSRPFWATRWTRRTSRVLALTGPPIAPIFQRAPKNPRDMGRRDPNTRMGRWGLIRHTVDGVGNARPAIDSTATLLPQNVHRASGGTVLLQRGFNRLDQASSVSGGRGRSFADRDYALRDHAPSSRLVAILSGVGAFEERQTVLPLQAPNTRARASSRRERARRCRVV